MGLLPAENKDIRNIYDSVLCSKETDVLPILQNFHVACIGYYINARGQGIARSSFDEHQLVYCISGKGRFEISEKKMSIQAGDVFYCPKGYAHMYCADRDEPWTILWVHFNGQMAEAYLENAQINIIKPVLNIGIDNKIITKFDEIFNILQKGYMANNQLQVSLIIQSMLADLADRKYLYKHMASGSVSTYEVIEFMKQHITVNLSLEDISTHFNISKYHFIRRFKQDIGITPLEYYNRLKIEQACEYLINTSKPIKEIASILGFCDQYAFSNAFKKLIGASPSNYRKGY